MSRMRSFALVIALVAAPGLALAGDLAARDVVELHRSGLGEDVLLALIEVDGGPFVLSHADLVDLKAEGLSDRVIAALIRTGRPQGRMGTRAHAAPPDPVAPVDDADAYADPSVTIHVDSISRPRVVAVPVPVYVPVVVPRRSPREGPDDPVGETPGVRRGPTTATSADSIRHAPPGFHPGSIGPRGSGASSSSAAAPSSAAHTPGVARSVSAGATRPATPGIARSKQ